MRKLVIVALATTCLSVGAPMALAGGTGDASPTQTQPAAEQEPSPETGTAGTDCLDRTVDAIQARYERVRDFSARFVQTARPAHIGAAAAEPITSRGRVVVSKPARMRWAYEEPEPSLVVSDGETLWIFDPAFGEAQRLPVGEGFLSGAAVQFLLGEGEMRRDFAITLLECAPDAVALELVPREPASYEKLRVVASPDDGRVGRTEVHDLLGNVTSVVFSEVEFDRDPPAGTFRFDPPEGVSVIDLTVPGGVPGP